MDAVRSNDENNTLQMHTNISLPNYNVYACVQQCHSTISDVSA